MAELIYKFITEANIKQVNEDERSFTAWASRSSIDRDDEEIDASGWITKDYRKNPVVPLFHDYGKFPIAKSAWEKPDPKDNPIGLLFKPIFADTMLGQETFYLYKEGFMNAFSVGFDPWEWLDSDGELHSREKDGEFGIWLKGYIEQKRKKPRCKFLKQKLLEISGVLVPAHPDALVETRSHIKTPELSKYIDEMINKSRKPMIPVEIDYKQKYFDSLEIISEQAQAILKNTKDADVIDSQDFDDGIVIDDDDIDLDEGIEVEVDALGGTGDISDIVVEISGDAGDDAEIEVEL
jgi:phage head maturation protease